MAACLNCTADGRVSPESVRRWTERLSNVLASPTGRRNFRDFLESRDLEEGISLLTFWELCDKYLKMHSDTGENPGQVRKRKTRSSERKTSSPKGSAKQETIDPQSILELADMEINLNAAEMEQLSSAVESGDTKRICSAVAKVKEISLDLLEESYSAFCSHLIKNLRV